MIDVDEVDDADTSPRLDRRSAARRRRVAAHAGADRAPDVPATAAEAAAPARGRRIRGALLLLIPLLLIIGLAVGAVGWYARRSYYVGTDDNQVVVFKGVPGGVLGWDPTVEQRSDLTIDELDYRRPRRAWRDGAARGSRNDGRATTLPRCRTASTRRRRPPRRPPRPPRPHCRRRPRRVVPPRPLADALTP